MVIDRASIFADRFKENPQILQAAVLGQAPVPGLDPYTALRAMQLLKESQQMQMAQAAQQPTNSPSLVQAAMQMPRAPMGMPVAALQQAAPQPQAAPQQAPMMGASGGLASMPTPEEDYAEGGIVAFAGPTGQNNYSLVQETPGGFPRSTTGFESLRRGMFEEDDESEDGIEDPVTQQMLARNAMQSLRAARKAERVAPMTPEQEMEYRNRIYRQIQTEAGTSPIDGFLAKYNITPEKAAKMDDEDLGMALLNAAGEAVKPVGTTRGIAAAISALGRSYGAAKKERRREEMATDRMRTELLDSQRKERMGMSKEASAAMERYRKDRQDATRANAAANRLEAQTFAQLTTAFRQPRGSGTAKPPSLPQVDRQLASLRLEIVDLENKTPTDPRLPVMRQQATALSEVLAASKDIGPTRAGLTEAEIYRRVDAIVAPQLLEFERLPSLAGDLGKRYAKLLREANTADTQKKTEAAAQLRAQAKTLKDQHEAELRRAATASVRESGFALPAARAATAARPAPPSGYVVDQQP